MGSGTKVRWCEGTEVVDVHGVVPFFFVCTTSVIDYNYMYSIMIVYPN